MLSMRFWLSRRTWVHQGTVQVSSGCSVMPGELLGTGYFCSFPLYDILWFFKLLFSVSCLICRLNPCLVMAATGAQGSLSSSLLPLPSLSPADTSSLLQAPYLHISGALRRRRIASMCKDQDSFKGEAAGCS